MPFVLIIMFFIAPPTLGANRPWALQSTQSIEFDSWPACDDAIRNVISPAVRSTDTMAFTAWCLPKGFKGKERSDFLLKPEAKSADRAKEQMAISGSCYDYVPPPVTGGKRKESAALNAKLVGQCHQN
jgi:hypothetical protein